MFPRIFSDQILSKHIKEACSENDISVEIAPTIKREDYIIIKPDEYYNSLKIKKRPAAVDCIIIQKCGNGLYKITLVELKDIRSSGNFDMENILDKFTNTLNKFIAVDFKQLLLKDYQKVELLFVSNIDIHKRDLGLKLETLINKRFTYNNKSYLIRPKVPKPAIKPCY